MQHAKVSIVPSNPNDLKVREAVHDGVRFVGGTLGQAYGIKVENFTRGRILAVITVDGRNVIDASPGDTAGPGYVIASGASLTCEGWRVSNESVASFVFTEGAISYAATALGDASNVGVIGVAVWREAYATVSRVPGSTPMRSAGTSFGEERDSRVTSTTFKRRGEAEIHTIHYNTIDALMDSGIIPRFPLRGAQPFPASVPTYCPRPSTQIG